MEKSWEFFERLDEVVYVSDMQTYQLEYMNRKALSAYGYTSQEEIQGKNCYEVLQNSSQPCTFCTNKYLKPNYFYEWQYTNPVIRKTYTLKDTVVEYKGRNYRMEIAIDISIREEQRQKLWEYANHEAMINEGLSAALAETAPVRAIEVFLEYLGQHLKSERIYIFEERKDGRMDNTFEWCAEGVRSEKENLQKIPFAALSLWYEAFEKKRNVVIKDLEVSKEEDPMTYEYLKPQGIRTLIASPLIDDKKIIGFYGVDNPPADQLNHISVMLEIIGHFITSLLKQRNLVNRLEFLSYYDQLTKLKNRHALKEYLDTVNRKESIGILYCDVMGLKKVNDTMGHKAGDMLLLESSECIREKFQEDVCFRIGGDEFLVMCTGLEERKFNEKIERIKAHMDKGSRLMALGYVWEPEFEQSFEQLLAKADGRMYQDKKKHYADRKDDSREGR